MQRPEEPMEGFTPEELEAEASEALPERTLMSTVGLSGVDPAGDAVDAVTESAVTTATAAAGDPSVTADASQPAPEAGAEPADATATPAPDSGEIAGTTAEATTPELGNTVEQAGETLPQVGDTVGEVGETATGSLPQVGDVDPSQLAEQLGSGSLLDLDVDLNAALDAAAPIDAAVAANANVAAPINAAVSANLLSPDSVSIASADQAAIIQQTLDGQAGATADQVSTIDQGESDGDAGATPGQAPQVEAGSGGEPAGSGAQNDAGTTLPEATAPEPGTTPATTDGAAAPAEGPDAQGLLDLDVDADLDLDVAAPINAAVAANANVAAPINASVSANVASPGAVSIGMAEQDALIVQSLEGEANAEADQSSAITQGEDSEDDGA